MKYSESQDCLTALVSHLALTAYKSRTPPYIADNISIPEEDVRRVLDGFPGIFRKSKTTSSANEHFYTLQIRYALRGKQYDDKTGEDVGTPLEIGHVISLLEFIAGQAHQEQDVSVADSQLQQTKELTQKELQLTKKSMEQQLSVANAQITHGKNAAILSFAASVLAAIAAIVAAIIAASIKCSGT